MSSNIIINLKRLSDNVIPASDVNELREDLKRMFGGKPFPLNEVGWKNGSFSTGDTHLVPKNPMVSTNAPMSDSSSVAPAYRSPVSVGGTDLAQNNKWNGGLHTDGGDYNSSQNDLGHEDVQQVHDLLIQMGMRNPESIPDFGSQVYSGFDFEYNQMTKKDKWTAIQIVAKNLAKDENYYNNLEQFDMDDKQLNEWIPWRKVGNHPKNPDRNPKLSPNPRKDTTAKRVRGGSDADTGGFYSTYKSKDNRESSTNRRTKPVDYVIEDGTIQGDPQDPRNKKFMKNKRWTTTLDESLPVGFSEKIYDELVARYGEGNPIVYKIANKLHSRYGDKLNEISFPDKNGEPPKEKTKQIPDEKILEPGWDMDVPPPKKKDDELLPPDRSLHETARLKSKVMSSLLLQLVEKADDRWAMNCIENVIPINEDSFRQHRKRLIYELKKMGESAVEGGGSAGETLSDQSGMFVSGIGLESGNRATGKKDSNMGRRVVYIPDEEPIDTRSWTPKETPLKKKYYTSKENPMLKTSGGKLVPDPTPIEIKEGDVYSKDGVMQAVNVENKETKTNVTDTNNAVYKKLLNQLDQLTLGLKVEKEHTKNIKDPAEARRIALKIASDHIKEDPHYYTKLNQAKLEETIRPETPGEKLNREDRKQAAKDYISNVLHQARRKDFLNKLSQQQIKTNADADAAEKRRQELSEPIDPGLEEEKNKGDNFYDLDDPRTWEAPKKLVKNLGFKNKSEDKPEDKKEREPELWDKGITWSPLNDLEEGNLDPELEGKSDMEKLQILMKRAGDSRPASSHSETRTNVEKPYNLPSYRELHDPEIYPLRPPQVIKQKVKPEEESDTPDDLKVGPLQENFDRKMYSILQRRAGIVNT